MATNFLKFCVGSKGGMAFVVGALGVDCAAGVGCAAGRIYTSSEEGASGSGLLVAWAVDFWGSSISSFPLPSSVSIGEVFCFLFCLHCSSTAVLIRHSSSGFTSSW